MMDILTQFIREQNIQVSKTSPSVVNVSNSEEGFTLTKLFFKKLLDRKTVVFLSGGRTPKQLYGEITKEEELIVGAVGLVDERYGPKMWENSNEKMIADTGLLGYLEKKGLPFYPILETNSHSGKQRLYQNPDSGQARMTDLEQTAKDYDETVRFLLNGFPKSIAVLGIGLDGHTAGIPVTAMSLHSESSRLEETKYVTYFTDFPGEQKERITMTFLGLSMVDILFVLVFGKDKKTALRQMFMSGSEEEIPSRFFKRPDIAKKTLLITDQKV